MGNHDFDRDEQQILSELQAARNSGLPPRGACPRPELLTAVRSGVPFEGSDNVLRHLSLCPVCRQLSDDLEQYEFPPVSDAEDRRIRARWQTAPKPSLWDAFPRWPTFALLAGAAAILTIFFLAAEWRKPAMAPVVAHQEPPRAPAPSPQAPALPLTKAPIKVPASAVLIFRGDGRGAQTYIADLASALEPYRADDYAGAAARLEPLSRKYPDAAEPPFYLGVSRLFLNQAQSAVESLETARRRPGDSLRDDISWYLAVAFERLGRITDVRREAEALCTGAGDYKDRACAASAQLKSR